MKKNVKDLKNIIMRYPEDKRSYFLSDMGKKQVLEQMISFELMNKLALEIKLNETDEYKSNLKQLEKHFCKTKTIDMAKLDENMVELKRLIAETIDYDYDKEN